MNNIQIAVPINEPICSRCNKPFVRDFNAKQGSATYYRCKDCLSTKSILVDTLYSCNIMWNTRDFHIINSKPNQSQVNS